MLFTTSTEEAEATRRVIDVHGQRFELRGYVGVSPLRGTYVEDNERNANELPRLMQAMAHADTGVWAIDGPGARRLRPGPDVSRSRVDGRTHLGSVERHHPGREDHKKQRDRGEQQPLPADHDQKPRRK